jgi:hypothetical protein
MGSDGSSSLEARLKLPYGGFTDRDINTTAQVQRSPRLIARLRSPDRD